METFFYDFSLEKSIRANYPDLLASSIVCFLQKGNNQKGPPVRQSPFDYCVCV